MPSATAIPIDQFLGKLSAVRQHGEQWMAQCPAHDDRTSSLSVGIGRDGKILLKCFAGCQFDAILDKLHIRQSECFATKATTTSTFSSKVSRTYDYRDLDGLLRYQVCRLIPKDFRQRRPDGAGGWLWNMEGVERFPYHLDQLKGHETVYIVEGEKDADALWALGLPATTNSGGTGSSWKESDTAWLTKAGVKRVILIPDNDAPGRKHMDKVAKSVKAAGLALRLLNFPDVPPKEDVAYWLSHGHTRAELETLVATKPWVYPRGMNGSNGNGGHPPSIEDELTQLRQRTTEGQADLFAARYGGEFRYNCMREMWLHYEAPCWRPDAVKAVYRAAISFVRTQQREAIALADPSAKRDALNFAIKAEAAGHIETLIKKSATWNSKFSDNGLDWDTDPWALAVNNGVIDLRTGILRPGNPNDRITRKCTVPYDPAAKCDRWWQFLGEIFDGNQEVIEFVWRLSGYILTGQTTERIVPMFYGRGANGKSVFLNVLSKILGDYAFALPFSSLQFQKQEGIPNDLAALVGRRLVTVIEANEGLRLNEAKLKTLSGNDLISARFLHAEYFTFQPVCKFVLAMNHKPVAKDDSPGFWDRIRLVPFLHTFPEGARDETLQATLVATEGAGILAWAVQGCLRWQGSGLTKPAAVVNATAEYQADSDQLAEFLAACCSVGNPDAMTGAGVLQKTYNDWTENRGMGRFDRLSGHALSRLLGERFQKHRTLKGVFYIGLEVLTSRLWE